MEEKKLENLLQDAINFAKKKELHGFSKNIGIAVNYCSTDDDKRQLLITEIDGLVKNSRFKEALEVTEKAGEYFTNGDEDFKNDVLMNRGVILGQLGEYDRAIKLLNQLTSSNIVEIKIEAYTNLAWIYILLYGREDDEKYLIKAEDICNQVLEKSESVELKESIHKALLTNLGCVYYNQGKYEKALEVFQEQKEKFAGEDKYPIIYNNIASVLVKINRIAEAKEYLHKALLKAESQKSYFDIAENYMISAEIAMLDEDYVQVKDNYVVAYDYFVKANNLEKACSVFQKIQRVDFEVSNESLGKLSKQFSTS